MSNPKAHLTEVPAYELLDASRRQSVVDPAISADGEMISFRDGVPTHFVDPVESVTQVYEQLSAIAGIDDFVQSRVRSHQIVRSVRRFFNPSSIIHKQLPGDEVDGLPSVRQRVREVSRIPGFRSGLASLLEWLHQPDEQIVFHTVEDVEFFDEDNPETWRKMHFISFDEMVERGKEIPFERDTFATQEYRRYEPLEIIALNAMKNSHLKSVVTRASRNPHAALEWFKKQNGEKRINLLCGSALGISHLDAHRIPEDRYISPQGKYLRDLLTMLADESLSPPFLVWEYTREGDEEAEVLHTARVFKGTPLHKQIKDSDDLELQITKTDEKAHPARNRQHPRRLHTVLVRERIVRPDIKAILEDQVDDSGDTLKSRVYGEILLSLLFMQEQRHMEEDEIAAIKGLSHADPTERLARKLALGLIFAAANGDSLRSILSERYGLILEAENASS